jgi:hypothetical protein
MRSHAGNMELQQSTSTASTAGMRDWIAAVRDIAIVAAFQMILRATLMMRRWNY